MSKIFINGIKLSGNNVGIVGGRVVIDGVDVTSSLPPDVKELSIRIIEGSLESLKCDGDVSIEGTVSVGSIIADGNVSAGAVKGSINADGNVKCDCVGGSVSADGNVSCGRVGGSVKASGNIRHA